MCLASPPRSSDGILLRAKRVYDWLNGEAERVKRKAVEVSQHSFDLI